MEESLTQGVPQEVASQEPTTQPVTAPTADGNQETISNEQSNEAVSTTPADNQPSGGTEDENLAKFAKGQGYSDEDIAQMTEREKKTLLSLKKNVDTFRNPDKKITETVSSIVDTPVQGESDNEVVLREIREYKYNKQVDSFWKDGNKDRSLEPIMATILNDKLAELTPQIGKDEARKYVFNLSRDFDTLYAQAKIKSDAFSPEAAKEEGRREERDSIKRQLAAAPDAAHAVQPTVKSTPKVTLDWIRNEYDSKNPEHVALVNAFYGKK